MINRTFVEDLLKNNKTPFYIFEEKEFEFNYKHLLYAFRNIYPNYQIAYSFKTNYTPYVCKCVKHMQGYAEVVSDMEYNLAKQLGFSNSEIIYNGPYKGEKLEEHILNGGIVNIDNKEEANNIIEIAKKNSNKTIEIGLRINFDIGANYISRFGLELNGKEINQVVFLLNRQKNIKIVGIHCHISRARGLYFWKQRIDNLLSAADLYCTETPKYIDVGSGMYADMDSSLVLQFDDNIPTYEQYAEVVAGTMKEHYKNCKFKPILFSEPGTTVIARYFYLVTKVINKKIVDNKCFVTVDSSFYNSGDISTMKQIPYFMFIETQKQKAKMPIDIVGYTCLEQDCLYKNFEYDIDTNDIIVFGNVGGYSIVSKPPFIQPNCPIYCVNKNNEIIKIKRAENYEDIFTTYVFE